jgi:hypothetical protein
MFLKALRSQDGRPLGHDDNPRYEAGVPATILRLSVKASWDLCCQKRFFVRIVAISDWWLTKETFFLDDTEFLFIAIPAALSTLRN